jgi:hypothetical protein
MYEKDKARYEKEMKQYAKEKPPKEPTKLLKTKKQKNKKTQKAAELAESDTHQGLGTAMENNPNSLESPTSQFNLLNNLPFTNLPSPMLDIGGDEEENAFDTFGYDTV